MHRASLSIPSGESRFVADTVASEPLAIVLAVRLAHCLSLSEMRIPDGFGILNPFISELGPIVLVANVLIEKLFGALGLGELLDNGRRDVVIEVAAIIGEGHGKLLRICDVAKATHQRGVDDGELLRHGKCSRNEGELTGEISGHPSDLVGEGIEALGEGRGLHGVSLFLKTTLPDEIPEVKALLNICRLCLGAILAGNSLLTTGEFEIGVENVDAANGLTISLGKHMNLAHFHLSF